MIGLAGSRAAGSRLSLSRTSTRVEARMTIMNAIATLIAVLPERTKNVSRYLTACRLIVTMMTDNTSFPAPTPPLADVTADLDTLAASEELARKGGKGMVEQRDVALRKVHS